MNTSTLTAIAWCFAVVTTGSLAQTDTAFTYQGSLSEQGMPASGSYNIDFTLWDALSGGTQIGPSVMLNAYPITEGQLSAELDFGSGVFDGAALWLEISVSGTELSPRQRLTRTPYAIASDTTRGISVDNFSRVGIGTTAPQAPLHIKQGNGAPIFSHSSSSVVVESPSSHYISLLTPADRERGFIFGDSTDTLVGGIIFNSNQAPNGFAIRTGGHTPRMFIDDEGNVELGTLATPVSLSVIGAVVSNGEGGGVLQTRNPNNQSASFSLGWLNDVARLRIGGDGPGAGGGLDIQRTGDVSLMRILHSGKVGIGTTTPSYALHVETNGTTAIGGEAQSGWGVLGITNDDHNGGVGGVSRSPSGTGVYGGVNFNTGVNYGVQGNSASPSGYDFYAAGVGINYGAPSSIRWKRNITPVTDPLGKLAQIRGVYYDWDEDHGGNHDIGFIGEEVGKVVPEIVAYETDSEYVTGMDYGRMTPLLVEAVNALRAEKDAEIADLTARLAHVERLLAVFAADRPPETSR